MSYVDLHAHILPAFDDGPRSPTEALELLRAAAQSGTKSIVATSHMFRPGLGSDDIDFARRSFESLRKALASSSEEDSVLADLELTLGAENYLGTDFLTALQSGRVLPLGDTRTLLIEIWPLTVEHTLRNAMDRVLDLGFTPLIAHVERYACFFQSPQLLASLVQLGCLAQVNAGAILRRHGGRMGRLAERWIEKGLVAVVASDMHNLSSRPPELDIVERLLTRRFDSDTADLLLRRNPSAILAGEEPLVPAPTSRQWWNRLRD